MTALYNFRNKVLLFSVCCALFTIPALSQTGTWNALTNVPAHYNNGVMLLLTDGTVICKNSSGGNYCAADAGLGTGWDRLTPVNGSYLNGTWSSIASMDSARLYFSTQVLRDGRVYACGGEYGGGGSWGEVYEPKTNTWSFTGTGGSIGHPFANVVSDANSEILPSGQILQASVDESGTNLNYLWNPVTNTYTAGPNCLRIDNEAVWVKLPDNSVLFMDNYGKTSERYIPASNTWINDATAPENLFDPYGEEAGAGFLLPNGKVWFIGSLPNTLYYTPSGTTAPGTWAAGPSIPDSLGAPDAASVMLPNGHILLALSHTPDSADHFPSPTYYYEFDYTTNTFTAVGAPGGGTTTPYGCYISNMLMLPDGTALFCNQGYDQYYQYVPGSAPLAAGQPTVTTMSAITCDSFQVTGKLFNGIGEGAAYGDDWQMNTNYPIARLTSASGVYYATSYNWNRIGAVMTGSALDTFTFRTPAGLPAGAYSLQVVANGNPSANFTFTTVPGALSPVSLNICSGSAGSLSDPTTGGAWSSSNTAVATVSAGTVMGISGGTTNISYTLSSGCSAVETVTVSTVPPAITGITYATAGSTSTLANATTGAWSSANTSIATVNAVTGVVRGMATGTTTISYANSCGSTGIAYTVVPGALCIPSPVNASQSCSMYGMTFNSLNIAGAVGTSINDVAACNGSGYQDRTALNCSFNKGNSYTAAITEASNPVTIQFWIDFNGDDIFQSTESVGGTTSLTSSGSITLTIPATAPTGTYRMRGIMDYTGDGHTYPGLNACMTGYNYGEARDYTVNIICNTGAISGNGIVCAGGTTTLADTTAGGTWSSSNPAIASVNSSGTVKGITGGNAIISYNAGSCAVVETVTVSPLPVLTVTPTTADICSGSSTTITASGASAYVWSPATGLSAATGATVNCTASVSTIYTITGTNASGCGSTAAQMITVNPLPVLTVTPTAAFCSGSSTPITASGAGTYIWSPAAGLSATTGATVSCTASVTSTYTITGTTAGCNGTATRTITVNPLPVLTVTPTAAAICRGSSASVTASGASTYVWSPATGLNATTGTTVSCTASVTTTYTITGTNASGCSGTATQTITVNPLPVLTVTPVSASICTGSSTSITASGASTYVWSPATGLNITTGATVSCTSSVTSTYTITGSASGCSGTATKTITVNTLPVLTVTPTAAAICSGSSTAITASGASTYVWSPATGLSASTGATVSCTASVTSTYTVTGTNASGCSGTGIRTITVNPVPALTVTATSAAICNGSPTSITASGAGTYVWSPATGLSATTGATVNCTASVTTTYTISGANALGCSSNTAKTIAVSASPVLTVTPVSSAICSGSSTSITASGASTYIWSPASGLSATTGSTVNCTASVTTTYTITGTNASGCSNTVAQAITVNTSPVLTVTPTAAAICSGSSTSVSASGASAYVWSPATGLSATTGNTVSCTASVTTTYTITGTNASGCSGTATQTITVNPLPVLTVTPASDTICTGSGTLVAASGAGTYIWSPATGLSATTGATVSCTVSVTTTYTITGVASGCSGVGHTTVTVPTAPAIPASIAGATTICSGTPVILTDATAGGVWSSGNPAIATISSSGVLTGITAGVATISYSITNACTTSRAIRTDTVIAAPSAGVISGSSSFPVGATATLTTTASGGVWSSSNPAIASVNSAGVVMGISAGGATISYVMANSCGTAHATFTVTVSSTSSVVQIITTIGGDHTAGYSGDGGTATSAALLSPSGIAVTSTGIVYFADQANNRIRKISAAGIITTIAGNGVAGNTGDGGAATSAELNDPMGVAVDAAGNVYIADYGNEKIRKINTSGIISTIAGTGTIGYSADGTAATAAEMARPSGVATDAAGNIYYTEQTNHIVRKINTLGIISTIAGNRGAGYSGDGGPATAAAISYPAGMMPDGLGNIYIVDAGNNRIRKVTAAGIISTVAGNGGAGYSGDGGSATAAQVNNPSGIAFDSTGALLIADLNNDRIRRVTTAGIISTISGTGAGGYTGDGGAATACTMYKPSGLAAYGGIIYVTDMGNNAIRKIGTSVIASREEEETAPPVATQPDIMNVKIFPNPSSGLLNVIAETDMAGNMSVVVVGVDGKIVYETSTQPANQQLTIPTGSWKNGIYIIKLSAGDQTITKIFVVVH